MVLLILVLFVVIGQSIYNRTLSAIEGSEGKAGAGCACGAGALLIVVLGIVVLAALATLMEGMR